MSPRISDRSLRVRRSAILLLFVALRAIAVAAVSDVDLDQELTFFPSMGHRSADGKGWEIQIDGCIYEPEKRRAMLTLVREALELKKVEMSKAENAIFAARARLFLVDHERDKQIVVRVVGKDFKLNKSEANGRFSGVIHLRESELQGKRSVPFQARLDAGDRRLFTGQITLTDTNGLTVISDIDDTIKITQVGDREATLRSTFLEPFQAVPGMAELYQSWAQKGGAQFLYASASPWQLFVPLNQFVLSNGFPAGGFYLKEFRWKDESFLSLFADPEKYKPRLIEPLLTRFPHRRFVLVGDSGERDPEVYGAMARRFPAQVAHIFIRETTREKNNNDRYRAAFRDVSAKRWTVFREPAELLSMIEFLSPDGVHSHPGIDRPDHK